MNYIIKKAPFTLLSFISLSVVFSQFLTVYYLPITWLSFSIIGAVCLTIGFFEENTFKVIFCSFLYFLGMYYFVPLNQPLSFSWFSNFWQQVIFQFQQISIGSPNAVSAIVALPLLLALLILLAGLMIQFERFMLSYLLMIGYLLTLSIFNSIQLNGQIAVVFGCAILSILFTKNQLPKKMVILMAGLTLLAGWAAYALPQSSARTSLTVWTAPVRDYLNQKGLYRKIRELTTSDISRTGFSENDQSLGGPLLDDNTILFEATQETSSYWRIESKDAYTGKGWEIRDGIQPRQLSRRTIEINSNSSQQGLQAAEDASIHFFNHGMYLPLPYGRSNLRVTQGSSGFVQMPESGRINFIDSNNGEKEVDNQWEPVVYQEDALQNVALAQPTDTVADYLQLPANLPNRVRDLSNEVTQNQTTLLERVTAIEEYLKNSGTFRYSKVDATVPEKNQDYVDQFLFESQVGYCDNFSSSMVVMLRTLGIPARWTKGFAPGDRRATSGDKTVFTVRNSHAHSWPEVYFAGYGWIPFEPTPSFSNPDRPATEDSQTSESSTPSSSTSSNSSSSSSSSSDATAPSEETSEVSTFANNNWRENIWLLLKLVGAILLVAIGYFVYKYSLRSQIYLTLKLAKRPLMRSYSILLKRAEKLLSREQSEPLADYAQRFEAKYPAFDGKFITLTNIYEAEIYGNSPAKQLDTILIKETMHLFERLKQ
ncbi:transglutaminase-like domain-containing protein [Candidatus Enterococcus ferrettii]|uniref:Transglutaminase-like domain-containing protein n=1 Tax=Candidatus Enterococcus ferrettii TaxID=2815324 RepID=A0ABV0ESS2_9ENTE|nr:transglutaminase-like domain-containing protein [Enterococcus sp. 665A]MBO1341533.1 transglutaminase domain-containing protein [Enterococcus sp. 665A]